MIKQFQKANPAIAILGLGQPGEGDKLDAVSALQAGAADFMKRPLDLNELVARVERHVQRQVRPRLVGLPVSAACKVGLRVGSAAALGVGFLSSFGSQISCVLLLCSAARCEAGAGEGHGACPEYSTRCGTADGAPPACYLLPGLPALPC